jgi:hypothetical protein
MNHKTSFFVPGSLSLGFSRLFYPGGIVPVRLMTRGDFNRKIAPQSASAEAMALEEDNH